MTIYIGTGWKMTKVISEARDFVAEINARTSWPSEVQPFILPPYTALAAVHDALDPATGVWIGAQNGHWMPSGPYTGEISMAMIRDTGATMVELGHSERRAAFNETDEMIALKTAAAHAAGLIPLVCVGESRDARARGEAVAFVLSQARAALSLVSAEARARTMIAYEPVWAIGDTGVPADPEQIVEVTRALSTLGVRAVLYGGSVDDRNAAALLATDGVDGLFVGRSAWQARGFLDLVDIAARAGALTSAD